MGRLRTNKNAHEILIQNKNFILDPLENKGKWRNIFINHNPIELEIGCGKGDFIIQLAEKNPDKNFIAIDMNETILLKINRKIKNLDLKNLVFFNFDAAKLLEIFEPEEISKIYINFPDPWPKKRHTKKRLTHHIFLQIYKSILDSNGVARFKTDNENLYNFSLESLQSFEAKIFFNTDDLYLEKNFDNEIISEYERKFLAQNFKIKQIDFKFEK